MDGEHVYSALVDIHRDEGPLPVGMPEEPGELATYRSVASGLAHEGKPYVVLAYAHDDAGAAEANAEAIRFQFEHGVSLRDRRPWSDRFALEAIRVSGTTVVARLALREALPGVAYEILRSSDSLTIHR